VIGAPMRPWFGARSPSCPRPTPRARHPILSPDRETCVRRAKGAALASRPNCSPPICAIRARCALAPNATSSLPNRSRGAFACCAADGASKPESNEVFASGLNEPFGIAFYPPGSDPQWCIRREHRIRDPLCVPRRRPQGARQARGDGARSSRCGRPCSAARPHYARHRFFRRMAGRCSSRSDATNDGEAWVNAMPPRSHAGKRRTSRRRLGRGHRSRGCARLRSGRKEIGACSPPGCGTASGSPCIRRRATSGARPTSATILATNRRPELRHARTRRRVLRLALVLFGPQRRSAHRGERPDLRDKVHRTRCA